jgi:hypothetical protein
MAGFAYRPANVRRGKGPESLSASGSLHTGQRRRIERQPWKRSAEGLHRTVHPTPLAGPVSEAVARVDNADVVRRRRRVQCRGQIQAELGGVEAV